MELRDYLRVIRTRKWVIVQAVVIVTAAALIASLLQPKTYQGECKVLISEKDNASALLGTVIPELSSQPERGLQTEVQLAQLRPLAEKTVRELGLQESPDALLERVDVSSVGQTNIISIKATDGSPDRAAAIANSISRAYVDWSRETKRESIKAAADEVEQRLAAAQSQILELGRKINAQGKSDELAAELQIATGAYTTMAAKLEELRVNEQLESGSGLVVQSAVVEALPVAPQPVRNSALGVVAGLIFGLAMAFLYEYLDNTIKSDEEAEKLFNVPVLGHIPFVKLEKEQKQFLAIIEQPGSAAAEAYRVLRNALDFVNFEHDIKTLMVTSPAPGEGKSTIAANLASSLAQAGAKVAMVSCDFRRPTTEGFFGVPNVLGLSDVLLGRSSLKAALQRPGDDQLVVLTSGKMPPNPSELLGSSKMQELVRSLEEWADWVIIDTPPLLAVSDGAAVARWANAVLVVTRAGISTRDAARKGAEMLAAVGAKAIGVVANGSDRAENRAGYYGAAYYYSNYYGYYSYNPYSSKRSKKHDSGAKAPVKVRPDVVAEEPAYVDQRGRRFGEIAARVLTAVMTFLVVVALAALVVFFLDQYFGWGFASVLMQFIR